MEIAKDKPLGTKGSSGLSMTVTSDWSNSVWEMSKSEISGALDLNAKTTERWLRVLKKDGLIEPSEGGCGSKLTRSARPRRVGLSPRPVSPSLKSSLGYRSRRSNGW